MPDAVHLLPCYVVTLPLHIPTTTTTTTITATTPAGLRVQPKDFYLLACLPACPPHDSGRPSLYGGLGSSATSPAF